MVPAAGRCWPASERLARAHGAAVCGAWYCRSVRVVRGSMWSDVVACFYELATEVPYRGMVVRRPCVVGR